MSARRRNAKHYAFDGGYGGTRYTYQYTTSDLKTAALTAELGSFVDTGSTIADALLRETLAQEVRIHRGEQEHFDWGQLAGAAVGSQIDDEAASTSNATATNGTSLSGFATAIYSSAPISPPN